MTKKLSLNDWGVSEHMQMMRLLQLAGSYDQLDLSNLAVAEAIVRLVELIESSSTSTASGREKACARQASGRGPARA